MTPSASWSRLAQGGPLIALLVLGLCRGPAAAQQAAGAKAVDVALCLDVSSSMDGLVAAAKQKLWDVVNDLARARPAPRLRVALFSYGNNAYDPRAGWVRQEVGLTDDLDRVSEKLFALQATKVPGSNEYVGRVCRDAVERLAWSADPGALRVIFVCGNEPANQDPEVKLGPLAAAAVRKGIIINTVYCGRPGDADAAGWKEFARLAEGRFAAIDQDRAPAAVATPLDKELAALSARLNGTFCFAGKDARARAANQLRQDANALRLGAAAAASRAESKAGGLYHFGAQDLVGRLARDPRFDLKKVPAEELPEQLRKMTPAQREQHVRGLLAQRQELQRQIADLAKRRDAYLRAERQKKPGPAGRAFDEAIRGALREQAKRKGIEVPE